MMRLDTLKNSTIRWKVTYFDEFINNVPVHKVTYVYADTYTWAVVEALHELGPDFLENSPDKGILSIEKA